METGEIKYFGEYKAEKLGEGLYGLEDKEDSSFYVLEGAQRAAVIDTGMGGSSILPVIRQLTQLPCVLLLTHAHGDHIKFAGEFNERYLCSQDMPILPLSAKRMGLPKSLAGLHYHQIEPGFSIDLGGNIVVEAVAMYGHTPGSLGFYCEKRNAFFCGDAVGSGIGVWMQVPGSLKICEYQKSLESFLEWAKKRGISENLEFLPGHRPQRYGFAGMERDNPVNLALVKDMAVLCQKLSDGSITGEENRLMRSFGQERARMATFGRADIVYLSSRVR